jgi:hypothetical protein
MNWPYALLISTWMPKTSKENSIARLILHDQSSTKLLNSLDIIAFVEYDTSNWIIGPNRYIAFHVDFNS